MTFTLFLGLSRYTLSKIEDHGKNVIQIKKVSREIANVVIGNRVFQDGLSDAGYVEDALGASR